MAKLIQILKRSADGLLDTVYPENIYCLCCGDSMENSRIHGICDVCASKIDWCTENTLKRHMDEFAFDELFMCCVYGFYPRQIMSRFKLAGNPYAARPLGRLLGERLLMEHIHPDALTAVPMHLEKLKKRGFNQAELLAEYAAKTADIAHVPGLLMKTEMTASMRLSDGRARRSQLEGSFDIAPKYRDWVRNKYIVIVDDVVTTGSTADACSRLLKEAGASRVAVLCFAGTSGWEPDPEREI
ncbi:MAG: ComF family protein [Firmicutes bacterium]|nr:ComF family protein [Bacillota bacterium]